MTIGGDTECIYHVIVHLLDLLLEGYKSFSRNDKQNVLSFLCAFRHSKIFNETENCASARYIICVLMSSFWILVVFIIFLRVVAFVSDNAEADLTFGCPEHGFFVAPSVFPLRLEPFFHPSYPITTGNYND